MLTQCPNCQTVFRLTGKALRAAHGFVRCGHCDLQFDAIHQLLDDDELDSVAEQASPHTLLPASDLPAKQTTKLIPKTESFSHEEIVMEGNRIEISGLYKQLDADDDIATITGTFAAFEEFNQAYSNWDISAEDIEATADDSLHTVDENEFETLDPQTLLADEPLPEADINQADTAVNAAHSIEASPLKSASEDSTQPNNNSMTADVPDEPALDSTTTANKTRHWPWATLSTVLILAVVAQGIHHYRQQLASNPSIGTQVRAFYTALGYPLPPSADITLYSSNLSSMVSDPQSAGTLQLNASITNQATHAQPYPWVSIRLENRFGTPIGARTFKPEEYLDKALNETLMASGVTVPINLAIVDPGQDAVGVKIDTCLPLSTGLHCTHQGQQ